MAEDEPPDEVGYKKPPKEHRWTKGTSGNPSGRPRGSRNKVPKNSLNPYLDIFLQEMDRIVSLKEGDKTLELPVFQASMRKLGIKAMTGDLRALEIVAERTQLAHKARLEEMKAHLRSVEMYKAEWEPKFEAARRSGRPEPTQLPHPAHVNISSTTLLIEITGPTAKEEKEQWDILKRDLRFVDEEIRSLEGGGRPHMRKAIKAECLKLLRKRFREWEKRVPPGWNWREEI